MNTPTVTERGQQQAAGHQSSSGPGDSNFYQTQMQIYDESAVIQQLSMAANEGNTQT